MFKFKLLGRTEEGRRKKEEGRRKKEEGRRKREEGRIASKQAFGRLESCV
ncbi:MAG: hypothetical protein HC894_06560 [Microcoleus sp. SM1_3_4]|nr:hypothetical protein [Microcoleus sp. SM1_3_4]